MLSWKCIKINKEQEESKQCLSVKTIVQPRRNGDNQDKENMAPDWYKIINDRTIV